MGSPPVTLSSKLYTFSFPGCPVSVSVPIPLIEAFEKIVSTTDGDRQGVVFGQAGGAETVVSGSCAMTAFGLKEMCVALADARDRVVGYYRIREGNSLELTADEVDLGSALFAEPGCVILLIERRAECPKANFFFFENGAFLNVPLLEFPLDSAALTRNQAPPRIITDESAVAPDTPGLVPRDSGSRAPSRPTSAERTLGRRRVNLLSVLAIVILLALVSLSAALFINRPRNPAVKEEAASRPVPAAGTPLRVERQGDDLKIMWDLNSPAVSAATSGVLDIDDGGKKRQIPMTSDQVRFGSVLYSPGSAQISVRMTTLKANQSTSEAAALVLLNKPPQPQPGAVQRAGATPIATASLSKPPQPGAGAGKEDSNSPFEVKTVQQVPTRAFVPPPPIKSEMEPPAISGEPPALQANPDRFVQPSPLTAASVAPPAALASSPIAPAKPVGEQRRLESVSPPAAAGAPRGGSAGQVEEYVAPVLITQGGLRMPPELPRMVEPVAIAVRVDVNETGRVTRAEAIAGKGLHALLLQAATDAAKKCRFQPARQGQHPVSSSVTIVFHVGGPEAQR